MKINEITPDIIKEGFGEWAKQKAKAVAYDLFPWKKGAYKTDYDKQQDFIKQITADLNQAIATGIVALPQKSAGAKAIGAMTQQLAGGVRTSGKTSTGAGANAFSSMANQLGSKKVSESKNSRKSLREQDDADQQKKLSVSQYILQYIKNNYLKQVGSIPPQVLQVMQNAAKEIEQNYVSSKPLKQDSLINIWNGIGQVTKLGNIESDSADDSAADAGAAGAAGGQQQKTGTQSQVGTGRFAKAATKVATPATTPTTPTPAVKEPAKTPVGPGGKADPYVAMKTQMRQLQPQANARPLPDKFIQELAADMQKLAKGDKDSGVFAADKILKFAKAGYDVSKLAPQWNASSKAGERFLTQSVYRYITNMLTEHGLTWRDLGLSVRLVEGIEEGVFICKRVKK